MSVYNQVRIYFSIFIIVIQKIFFYRYAFPFSYSVSVKTKGFSRLNHRIFSTRYAARLRPCFLRLLPGMQISTNLTLWSVERILAIYWVVERWIFRIIFVLMINNRWLNAFLPDKWIRVFLLIKNLIRWHRKHLFAHLLLNLKLPVFII